MLKYLSTRQGVRDLSKVGSRKSVGRKVELPPEEAFMTPDQIREKLRAQAELDEIEFDDEDY